MATNNNDITTQEKTEQAVKLEIPVTTEPSGKTVTAETAEASKAPKSSPKPDADSKGVYTDTQGRPQFMPETVEDADATYGSDTNRTLEDLVKEEAKEDDNIPASKFSLNRTLGGVILARAIQKQIGLVLLITAFLIIYINNRYMCQKQTVEIDKLEKKLTETRYKATVCTSILTEKSRESNILNMLRAKGDTTLTIPQDPPYLIRLK